MVKCKFFTSPIDPFATSDVSDVQNCGKTGGVLVVVFVWWCFCFGVVVFLWWCFCACVFVVFLCFCGGVFVCLFCQGSTFVALPRSYAKSVDNTGVKKMCGIKVLLTLLISTLTSNISFFNCLHCFRDIRRLVLL